ncbi:MAG: YjfK family protein [Pseudomonadales bacterium]|nr:YjfK family protein [Pseudomonadales bacterium]
MLSKLFGRKKAETNKPTTPEIMGLHLGGAFELDKLRIKLIEPDLIVEGLSTTQFIEAVGVIKLDTTSTVLRFYTDDEGFIEVLLDGGMHESNIADVKLWYFYDTQGIASDKAWDATLKNQISKPQHQLDGFSFDRVWNSVEGESPVVAMTEKTYHANGEITETDQFVMLYERQATDSITEYCRLIGEEKIINNVADRYLVCSTGFDLRAADIEVIG